MESITSTQQGAQNVDAHDLPTAEIALSDVAAPTAAPTRDASPPVEMDPVSPELLQAVVDDFLAGWKMDERHEFTQYDKYYAAIYNGKVVGVDKDGGELYDRMLREKIVPEERLVIIFVGNDKV